MEKGRSDATFERRKMLRIDLLKLYFRPVARRERMENLVATFSELTELFWTWWKNVVLIVNWVVTLFVYAGRFNANLKFKWIATVVVIIYK